MSSPNATTEIDARLTLGNLLRGISRLAAGVTLKASRSYPAAKRRPHVLPVDLYRALPGILDAAADLADAAEVSPMTRGEIEFMRQLALDIQGRPAAEVTA